MGIGPAGAVVVLLAAGIAYVYVGYPLILWLVSALRGKPVDVDAAFEPTVAVVVAAYNEEEVIQAKLDNLLALDYPRDKLELVVGSDASTDGTDAIVQRSASRGITFHRQEDRRGKRALLSALVPMTRAEVLVFSDANAMLRPDALRMLVRNLADPSVGFVSGESRYADPEGTPAGRSESLYWRYELALRRWESALTSAVGADGAIYALRRKLFRSLGDEEMDDFVNPLRAVSAGWRGVVEPAAVSCELASGTFAGEYRRKVRICNGAWRGVMSVKGALNPLRTGLFAWQLASHKVLRWLTPFFLIALLPASALAAWEGSVTSRLVLVGQLALYALALLGLAIPPLLRWRPIYLAYYFCLMNLAALVGLWKAWRGQAIATWQPERHPAGGRG